MSHRCIMFMGACVLSGLLGCQPGGASSSGGSISKSSYVRTYRAPEAMCVLPPRAEPLDAVSSEERDFLTSEELLVNAEMSEQGGVSLTSEGARLGDVLEALARSANIPILIRGIGAKVPIFAMYESEQAEPRTFLRQVAASGGMMTVEHEGTMYVLDPHEAAEFKRSLHRRGVSEPSITIEYATRDASMLAPALAKTVLGCNEQLTFVSQLDAMWLQAPESRASQLAALLSKIDTLSEGEHVTFEASPSRQDLRGVAHPTMRPCALETRTSDLDAELSYTLGMRTITLSDDVELLESFVIGCGAMAHMDGWIAQEQGIAMWLEGAGMRTVGPKIYTTREIATAWAIDDGQLRVPASDHVIMALRSARAPLLVSLLDETNPELSPSLATRDVLLLRGKTQDVEAARQFVLNIAEKR